MGRVADQLDRIGVMLGGFSTALADLATEVRGMEGGEDRPITEADLRRFKMMEMWSAANPDWEG